MAEHGTVSAFRWDKCRCEVCVTAKRERDRAYYLRNQERIKARTRSYANADPERKKAQDKAYREANADTVRAQKRSYYEANAAEVKRRVKEWREANPEKRRAQSQRAYQRDLPASREKGREAARERRRADPEKARAYARAYSKTPNGRRLGRLRAHARRGILYNAESREWVAIIENDPCVYCGAPSTDIEHIIPVNGGGSGEWDNLAMACRSCNGSKNDKSLLMFLASR